MTPRLPGSKAQHLATLSLSLVICEMGLTITMSLGCGKLSEIALSGTQERAITIVVITIIFKGIAVRNFLACLGTARDWCECNGVSVWGSGSREEQVKAWAGAGICSPCTPLNSEMSEMRGQLLCLSHWIQSG